MASEMPLPVPPRTPTPPPEDHVAPVGLGFENQLSPTKLGFNTNALSPLSATFPSDRYATLAPGDSLSQKATPSTVYSPASGTFPYTPASAASGASDTDAPSLSSAENARNPFNFQSVSYMPSKPQAIKNWGAHESLALTVLSRLIFYDAIGAFLCVFVDVGANFEVWKRSTIRHPFGFERSEVIAGLGMSVGLLFMGLDLISHGMTHALEDKGGHTPHHAHAHERVSPGSIDLAALSGIICTVVSAMLLKNHARIGKVMRLGAIANLPSVLSNPSHFLTLSCSSLLLILPLLSIRMYVWLDRTLSFSVAIAMVALGWVQGWSLGKMLMMSYSGAGVSAVMYDIETDPAVSAVDEAKFWQVHYGLCQANLKLRVRNLEEIGRLRDRVASMVRNRLGGGYGGGGGQKWEVSTQITLEKD
ncbi:cation diffusion zinc membrane transporter Zrg17 [Kalmusia sp. IMI 367209]|nr:cation diffusion zinc membrane transporter Zrg17 [Kalmusia sp. IMI 367209]